MQFAHDTEEALLSAAALVNTVNDTEDALADMASWREFLRAYPYSGQHLGSSQELDEVRSLRPVLRGVWEASDRDTSARLVNDILQTAEARPFLTRHDDYDWHLHVTEPSAPLAQRIAAEAAMGFLDLIRAHELDRLKICAGDDCHDVLVDLSRNKSKRFCSANNCGNRMNVAAYRSRLREQRQASATGQ